MKLSVVIPVYCVEDTLERCVGSVLSQNVYDMEVILIDDGSPDRCPEMCDEWSKRDSRIRVVHKSNGGLSDARNAGIEKAEGEYITFVDSDDFIEKNTYGPLMHMIGMYADVDILEYPVFWHYGAKEQTLIMAGPEVYDNMDAYWLKGRAYRHAYICNKIFRHTLFDEVRFPEGQVFEDVATLPLLLRKARKVVVVPNGVYYYCSNPNGITQKATGSELSMLLESHLAVMADKRKLTDPSYYMHVLNIQMDVYELTRKEPILPFVRICPLASNLSVKERLKALLLNILGIKKLCLLNKSIHRIMGCRS